MPSLSNVFSSDARLSQIAIDASGGNTYIADRIFPKLTVNQYQGKIYKLDTAQELRRQQNTLRAPGTTANRFDIDVSAPISFQCDDHALDSVVPNEIRAARDPALVAAINETEILTEALMLDREIKLASTLATDITQTSSPSTKWLTHASATPLADIRARIQTVKDAAGVKPNTLAMDDAVLSHIVQTAEFKDEVKYTVPLTQIMETNDQRALVLAALLGLREVIVAEVGLKNTAAKGKTASLSSIWDDTVYLFYKDPNPRPKYKGLGMILEWESGNTTDVYVPGGNPLGGIVGGYRVLRKYDDDLEAERIRVGCYYDLVTVNAAAGYKFTNVLTA